MPPGGKTRLCLSSPSKPNRVPTHWVCDPACQDPSWLPAGNSLPGEQQTFILIISCIKLYNIFNKMFMYVPAEYKKNHN